MRKSSRRNYECKHVVRTQIYSALYRAFSLSLLSNQLNARVINTSLSPDQEYFTNFSDIIETYYL